jgi:pyruvate carboxylase
MAGRLYDLGEFPGAIPSELPGEEVEGELYELGDLRRQLKALDEYEEFNPDHPEECLFIRQRVDVQIEDGERLKAWAYLLPRKPADARRIVSGDYLKFRGPQRLDGGVRQCT